MEKLIIKPCTQHGTSSCECTERSINYTAPRGSASLDVTFTGFDQHGQPQATFSDLRNIEMLGSCLFQGGTIGPGAFWEVTGTESGTRRIWHAYVVGVIKFEADEVRLVVAWLYSVRMLNDVANKQLQTVISKVSKIKGAKAATNDFDVIALENLRRQMKESDVAVLNRQPLFSLNHRNHIVSVADRATSAPVAVHDHVVNAADISTTAAADTLDESTAGQPVKSRSSSPIWDVDSPTKKEQSRSDIRAKNTRSILGRGPRSSPVDRTPIAPGGLPRINKQAPERRTTGQASRYDERQRAPGGVVKGRPGYVRTWASTVLSPSST